MFLSNDANGLISEIACAHSTVRIVYTQTESCYHKQYFISHFTQNQEAWTLIIIICLKSVRFKSKFSIMIIDLPNDSKINSKKPSIQHLKFNNMLID